MDVTRYLKAAERCERVAQRCVEDESRAFLLDAALHWRRMASEAEDAINPLSPEVRLLIDLDLSVVISPNWKTFGDFRA
jgi:hypothetical protein